MNGLRKRLGALERQEDGSRMIVAKLPASADLDALLTAEGITYRPNDLLVRITRPQDCGSDFARVIEGVQ
ncbi:MAG: hypothetical protein ACLGHC_01850 [Alphaproteobacteria bacterium]